MYTKMKSMYIIACLFIIMAGCRKDDKILEEEVVPVPEQKVLTVEGFYLLNEGNMGTNMSTLDYYDYAGGIYRSNIYAGANPSAVKELGDVGNDIGIYGNKLYAVINASNKVEVMDATTTKRLGIIDARNCRYITFAKGKAYVSAYDGSIAIGQGSPYGFVAEIDTNTLQVTRKVTVGRQPEEMAVVGNKLYIANSGGYDPNNYERTVSVIDLNSFTKIKDIDVAINLHRLKADSSGNLYVTSRGDYYNTPSKLFVINTQSETVSKTFDVSTANLTITGDTAYIVGSEFSYETFNWTTAYNMINVKTQTLLNKNFITDNTHTNIRTPYGLAVDPVSRNIYITDAKDYVSSGTLYGYTKEGKQFFSATTGNIPAHIAFKTKTK
jgi:YVTN family beta-propeller protein